MCVQGSGWKRVLSMLCVCVCRALTDGLVAPLELKIEEGKRVAGQLDKDHAKGMHTHTNTYHTHTHTTNTHFTHPTNRHMTHSM